MNGRSTALLLLFLTAVSLPSRAQEKKPPPVVAVFEIENRGSPLSADELIALTDYLGTKLGERGRFQIIPRQEIKKRLVQQKKASFKQCYDQSCQIEVGRELAAQFTVSASISKVGRTCIVTSALFDLRKAATTTTASAKGKCTADDLLAAMEKIADKLEGEKPPTTPRVEPPVRRVEKQPLPAPQPPPAAPVRQPRTKSTVAACLLSFIPGGGMFYLEKWGWGTFYLVGAVGGIVAGGVLLGTSAFEGDDGSIAAGIALLVAGVVIHPIGIIHTYSAAENWRDPDVERISPGQKLLPVSVGEPGRNSPALVIPIFSGRF